MTLSIELRRWAYRGELIIIETVGPSRKQSLITSDLFKLLFADDESVVSSISVDSANQNQKQSHDDLNNPHRSQAIEVCENDDIPIESDQFVSNKRTKKEKHKIDKAYDDQCTEF